jgi:hypothetical protein
MIDPTYATDVYLGTAAQGVTLLKTVTSGTYTPTLSAGSNLDSSFAYLARWERNGDNVTVSGQLDLDPTATGYTLLKLSLPIPSNLTGAGELTGIASTRGANSVAGSVSADATNDLALLEMTFTATTLQGVMYSFTYKVQ